MKVEELATKQCWEVVKRTGWGRIACSQNDQPYIVPFEFVSDNKKNLYGFASVGQKIEWMRKNPLVCVEIEERDEYNDQTTLVIFGRYEELPDTPEFESQRIYAHELLSRRPMWWQSVYVSEDFGDEIKEMPVFFRIIVDRITGHRVVSGRSEAPMPRVAQSMSKSFG
ncbi:MAG: pyridoxamine 5'-phosphate oxidase family protein [Acidobacteriota bacterium]|nr:pyridoxamine 5'-phosphate oxidase family protein [Acidobacteriota bacterium]